MSTGTIFEKGLFLGLGAVAMTREKAQKLVDELIEKGRVSKEESPKIMEELMNRAEEERKAFEEKLDKMLEHTMKRLGVPTKKEIDELNKKLDKVLSAVEKLSQ